MPITTAVCNSFKQELLQGLHDLDGDSLKLALIADGSVGTLDATVTNYSDLGTDEVSGTGYTAGGEAVANVTVTTDSGKAIVDFDDIEWTGASFTARGCLLYNATQGNAAIAVYDFGADTTITNGVFIARVPAATAATAILRAS